MKSHRTNVVLDEEKLEYARRLTGLPTTKAVIDFALERLAKTSKGLTALVDLSGKVRFRRGYSYKKYRQ